MMDYQKFCGILNKHIFEGEKRELLKKVADWPERFIGLFRPSKPGTKILQLAFFRLSSLVYLWERSYDRSLFLYGYFERRKNNNNRENKIFKLVEYYCFITGIGKSKRK